MPVRRLSDVVIVSLALSAMVLLGVVGAVVAPGPDAAGGGASTYSAGPSGTKAAFVTLRELGYGVDRSIEPMTALKADPQTTVLIVTGDEDPSGQDRRAARRFLEAGGVILATGANGAKFVGMTPPAPAPNPAFPADNLVTYRPLLPSALASRADAITMRLKVAFPKLEPSFATVYGLSADEAVVATASVGAGRAIWWASATPLTNDQVGQADNFQLLLNAIGPAGSRRILWDEHYQGHKRSLWSYAKSTPLPWIGLQAALLALAGMATFSRRHGPVRADAAETRTSPMEFVDMLGALYRRAGAGAAAVHAARARLRRALATRCGVPANSADTVLAGAAAARLGLDAEAIADLLTESERAAAGGNLEAAEALTYTRRLQQWTARLHAVTGGDRRHGGRK